MSKLHDAMAFARTAPAHPVVITDLDGGRDYGWACPPECGADPCLLVQRLREADWDGLAAGLPAGNYLAVPTLWGVDLTGGDGGPLAEWREPYRDDVREPLEAAGWRENDEGHVVAPNGALWTETNAALDSGVDAPDKAWSVELTHDVPAAVVVAAALAASGVDVVGLVADVARLRAENRELRRELKTSRDRWTEGLRRADEHVREMNEELKRYADGAETPVLWSVYNAMHVRAAAAERRVAELEAGGR